MLSGRIFFTLFPIIENKRYRKKDLLFLGVRVIYRLPKKEGRRPVCKLKLEKLI